MNLPNKLTLLRIALVPVYLLLMWLGQGAFAANVAALAVFARPQGQRIQTRSQGTPAVYSSSQAAASGSSQHAPWASVT